MTEEQKNCKHTSYFAKVHVATLTNKGDMEGVVGYIADFSINCSECGQAFEFVGVPVGFSPFEPMTSIDFTQLRIPIRPSLAPPVKSNEIVN